jgi:hypothetical protein
MPCLGKLRPCRGFISGVFFSSSARDRMNKSAGKYKPLSSFQNLSSHRLMYLYGAEHFYIFQQVTAARCLLLLSPGEPWYPHPDRSAPAHPAISSGPLLRSWPFDLDLPPGSCFPDLLEESLYPALIEPWAAGLHRVSGQVFHAGSPSILICLLQALQVITTLRWWIRTLTFLPGTKNSGSGGRLPAKGGQSLPAAA